MSRREVRLISRMVASRFLNNAFHFFHWNRDLMKRYHNPCTVDEESSLRYLKYFALVPTVLYRRHFREGVLKCVIYGTVFSVTEYYPINAS